MNNHLSNQRDIGAALLSLFVPGLGQMVQGKVLKGVLWLCGVALGYTLFVLPGFVAHLVCIVNAAKGDE